MSQIQERKPRSKAHKRRPSQAKFNRYGSGGLNGRWNNTVDAFGSAGMNTAPFRKPSYNRLSNSRLQRMSIDVAANVPCRKCSHNNLALHARQLADGPVNVPARQESDSSVSDQSGNRATAALNFHLRNSSKTKNKNFQWTANSKDTPNARTNPPMIESVFSFNPPSPSTQLKKKNPPAIPTRRESIMEFNILNNFEECQCTCGGADQKPSLPLQPSTMMPPPIPARKESLMDFDDLSSHGSSGQILPPPAAMNVNRNWNPTLNLMGSSSDPSNGLGTSDHSRRSSGPNMFLAMPPMTKFERKASAATAPPMPTRRGSVMDPPLMGMPLPTTLGRQSSLTIAPVVPQRKDQQAMPLPTTLGRQSSLSAPVVPQRKESLMDMNDCQ